MIFQRGVAVYSRGALLFLLDLLWILEGSSNKDNMLRAINYLSTRISMAARPHDFRRSICSLYFLGSQTLRTPDRESKWFVSSKKGVGSAIPSV